MCLIFEMRGGRVAELENGNLFETPLFVATAIVAILGLRNRWGRKGRYTHVEANYSKLVEGERVG